MSAKKKTKEEEEEEEEVNELEPDDDHDAGEEKLDGGKRRITLHQRKQSGQG